MWCKNYRLALKGSPKISNKGNLSKIRVHQKLGYLTLFPSIIHTMSTRTAARRGDAWLLLLMDGTVELAET